MRLLILPIVALLLASRAGHPPEIKPYVGAVREVGHGRTAKPVDGVQFWDNEAPNRKFVHVGPIDEDVKSNPTPKELKPWAQAGKPIGGDAVIWPSRDAQELTAKVAKVL